MKKTIDETVNCSLDGGLKMWEVRRRHLFSHALCTGLARSQPKGTRPPCETGRQEVFMSTVGGASASWSSTKVCPKNKLEKHPDLVKRMWNMCACCVKNPIKNLLSDISWIDKLDIIKNLLEVEVFFKLQPRWFNSWLSVESGSTSCLGYPTWDLEMLWKCWEHGCK